MATPHKHSDHDEKCCGDSSEDAVPVPVIVTAFVSVLIIFLVILISFCL